MADKSVRIRRKIRQLEQKLQHVQDPHEKRNIRRQLLALQRQLRPGWGSE